MPSSSQNNCICHNLPCCSQINYEFYDHRIWWPHTFPGELGNPKWKRTLVAKRLNHRYFLHSVIVSSSHSNDWRSNGRLISKITLWPWPLTCEMYYFVRSSLGMYNLERRLRCSHYLTRYRPHSLLSELTSPESEYRWQFWGYLVTSSMTSSP